MSGIHSCSRALALALLFAALPLTDAFAHCFVGARFLPATLATDDPCVADEMSLPTISWSRTADMPPATEWDVGADISKRITQDFGVSHQRNVGAYPRAGRSDHGGFRQPPDRVRSTSCSRTVRIELAMLLGLVVDWGSTGAINSGIADAV